MPNPKGINQYTKGRAAFRKNASTAVRLMQASRNTTQEATAEKKLNLAKQFVAKSYPRLTQLVLKKDKYAFGPGTGTVARAAGGSAASRAFLAKAIKQRHMPGKI